MHCHRRLYVAGIAANASLLLFDTLCNSEHMLCKLKGHAPHTPRINFAYSWARLALYTSKTYYRFHAVETFFTREGQGDAG